jgi:hypothetical protein
MDARPHNSSTCGQERPIRPMAQVPQHLRSIASERLEAGAIAMAPVPEHLLDSVEALYAEYCSVKAECLKLNASTELNAIIAIWEKKVQNLPQTLGNLDEIRDAAMKLESFKQQFTMICRM